MQPNYDNYKTNRTPREQFERDHDYNIVISKLHDGTYTWYSGLYAHPQWGMDEEYGNDLGEIDFTEEELIENNYPTDPDLAIMLDVDTVWIIEA